MTFASGTSIGIGPLLVATFQEDIDLGEGARVAICGTNGSGKTTLLGNLQGLTGHHGERALFPLRDSILLPERLDWADDLSFSTALKTLCAPPHRPRFEALAKAMNLPLLARYGTLSKGNRQKMSVILVEAMALTRGKRWILLDEPLSGLDTESQAALADFWKSDLGGPARLISSHGDPARLGATLLLRIESGSIRTASPSPVSARHDF